MIGLVVVAAIFIWIVKEIKATRDILVKLRLCVFRIATERPHAINEQANSIIGLEADVCAIRKAIKRLQQDVQEIKGAVV
jgi:hypothetical protein